MSLKQLIDEIISLKAEINVLKNKINECKLNISKEDTRMQDRLREEYKAKLESYETGCYDIPLEYCKDVGCVYNSSSKKCHRKNFPDPEQEEFWMGLQKQKLEILKKKNLKSQKKYPKIKPGDWDAHFEIKGCEGIPEEHCETDTRYSKCEWLTDSEQCANVKQYIFSESERSEAERKLYSKKREKPSTNREERLMRLIVKERNEQKERKEQRLKELKQGKFKQRQSDKDLMPTIRKT